MTKELDPVVDKSLEKQRPCPTCGCELYNETGSCKGSTAIEDFIKELLKRAEIESFHAGCDECELDVGSVIEVSELKRIAEELKLKIDKGE